MALLVYLPSLTTPFSYDDVPLIAANALLRDASGLHTLLTHARMTSAPIWPGHYRPLLMLTLWLQYRIAGAAPWSYRLVNVFIHLANALLVFVLARKILTRSDGQRAQLIASLAASLWLVHPINALSCELVLKRNSSLCALLMLAALLLFERRYFVALLLGALAMLVKEDALVLPGLIAIVAAYEHGKIPWRRVLPFAVFPLGMAIWAVLQHHDAGSALAYAAAQPIAVARYLGMLIDPRTIAAAYDLEPAVTLARVLGLLTIVAIAIAAFIVRRRAPLLSLSIAWIAIALAPSSSLIPIAPAMDEIRVYLAFIPLFILVAALLVRLRFGLALACVLAIVSARVTFDNAERWRDPTALWSHAVAHNPRSKIGNRALCEAQADPAQCNRSVALWPDDEFTRYDLVAALARAGRLEDARAAAALAVRDLPRAPMSWLAAGHVAWIADRRAEAEGDYRTVLLLDPTNDSARIHLADVLLPRDRQNAEQLIQPLKTARPADPADAALLDSLRVKLR